MRRIAFMLLAAMLLCAVGAFAQSESLGDYAREVRKEKRTAAKKNYTNDNLPSGSPLSVVGPSGSAPAAEEKDADKTAGKDKKNGKAGEKKPAENQQALRDKIADQEHKVADLSHELDLLQREYKLRITAYYADAGTQLRDSKRWAEEDNKYRADIADKQKQIDDAKAQLGELQEKARQAGARNSD